MLNKVFSSYINWKLAAISSICASGALFGLLISEIFKRKKELPEKWIKVGSISQLIVYPVKSCKWIEVESADVTNMGLRVSRYLRDRAFMIIDSKGIYQGQMKITKLAILEVEVNENKITLSGPGTNPITFTPPTENSKVDKQCKIIGENLKAIDCGDKVAAWLDTFTGKSGLRLVYHPDTQLTQRTVTNDQKQFDGFDLSHKGLFQDETSYMMMTEESVRYLNTKLKTPVTQFNFRPTIVIKGTYEPFAEDFWSYVKIGSEQNEIILRAPMPCIRCKTTTVDPNKGIFDPDGEPLKTLRNIKRQVKDKRTTELTRSKAVMGLHLGLIGSKSSSIKIGDPVYVAIL